MPEAGHALPTMPIPLEARLADVRTGGGPLAASFASAASEGLAIDVGVSTLTVSATPTPTIARLLIVTPGVLTFALWGLILHRLRTLVGKLEHGLPFVPDNGRRLVHIGLAILGIEVCDVAFSVARHAYVSRLVALDDGALALGLDPNATIIIVGLLLVVVGEAFRVGAFLQDEYDATA